jgi:GNAT superfamily N-acetyltransferase
LEPIITGYVPGAIGRIIELHGTYYAEQWNLGPQFESEVAAEIAAFYSGFDPKKDGFWVASMGGRVVGGITIVGREGPQARLRWFILDTACAGRGLGRRLMQTAVDFCDERGFSSVQLWTMAGLDAARHLYESFRFRLIAEHTDEIWGTPVRHQHFIRDARETSTT